MDSENNIGNCDEIEVKPVDFDDYFESLNHPLTEIKQEEDDNTEDDDNLSIEAETKVETKKRKLEEKRRFHSEWEDMYFFIQIEDNAVCLICGNTISILKAYNLRRHYEKKHSEIDQLSISDRKATLESLKIQMTTPQNESYQQTLQSNRIISASFRISHIIAKKMKPFREGDYIKECIIAAVEELCPQKLKIFNQISLSRATIVRRIADISTEICASLDTITKTFVYFSLALINDNAQLAIFIRGVDSKMNVTEELLDFVSVNNTNSGRDIKDAVINCMQIRQIDMKNLIGIATDGAPSMVGKNVGAVNLIFEHIKASGKSSNDFEMFICHCFLQVENLYAQVLNTSHVMSVVVKVINSIKSNSSKHRKFQEYLREIESEYGELICFGQIRCLSRGNCLLRFWELRNEIRIFMNLNGNDICEFYDDQWLLDLCFLIDITMKLNELNQKLQGEDKLITECYQDIKSFISKLKLFEKQLRSNNAIHFPLLNDFNCDRKDFSKYSNEITKLVREFDIRFSYIQKYEEMFKIFLIPFNVEVESAPPNMQMELRKMQSNLELKYAFNEDRHKCYQKYILEDNFPNLKRLAMCITASIGTTYRCESFFSNLKSVQTRCRSRLVDENTTNQLLCASSKIPVYTKMMSSNIHKQASH